MVMSHPGETREKCPDKYFKPRLQDNTVDSFQCSTEAASSWKAGGRPLAVRLVERVLETRMKRESSLMTLEIKRETPMNQ